ncbi:DivIVA domain-containing protein [Nonomuraea sp. NPDC004354]
MKLGYWMLGIGAVVLLVWLVVSKDAQEPRCGGERMSSGDYCSNRRTGPDSYEEKKEDAAAVAFGMGLVGGTLVVGGALLVVGERATRSFRDGSRQWARIQRRRAQLVLDIRATELPLVSGRGYNQREVDAYIERIIAGLEGREPAVRREKNHPSGISILHGFSMASPGYDIRHVDAFLDHLYGLLDRVDGN